MTRLFAALFSTTLIATLFNSQPVFAAPGAQAEPTQVGVTFARVYVPVGFDSNDHVQFVGEGMFKNACYRPAPTTVSVDTASKTIKVGPVAYEYKGFCLQVILPFDRVVDVGILEPGTWQIVNATDGQALGQVSIAPATTADPDDYLYAPVAQAYVRQSGKATTLILNGTFPSSCMAMKDVKVNIIDNVIVVQPIAEMAQGTCTGPATSFTKTVKLGAVKAGRYLLHVRSMNGNAVNALVDVQ